MYTRESLYNPLTPIFSLFTPLVLFVIFFSENFRIIVRSFFVCCYTVIYIGCASGHPISSPLTVVTGSLRVPVMRSHAASQKSLCSLSGIPTRLLPYPSSWVCSSIFSFSACSSLSFLFGVRRFSFNRFGHSSPPSIFHLSLLFISKAWKGWGGLVYRSPLGFTNWRGWGDGASDVHRG